jgi:hypothetical protein
MFVVLLEHIDQRQNAAEQAARGDQVRQQIDVL